MRWDNVTVLNSGHSWVQFKALGPCGPLGFKLNPLVPRVKYGKIIPPHYSHPHIVNSYYYNKSGNFCDTIGSYLLLTIYYMRVLVIRWDNIIVVYKVLYWAQVASV